MIYFRFNATFYFPLKYRQFPTQFRHKCSKSKEPPWNILFFGTGTFALESLKPLCSKLRTGTLISRLDVTTFPGTPVSNFCDSECLQMFEWPVNPEVIRSKYDIGMVVQFGKLITKEVIDAFPLGCINVHSSILPRWRGAAPIIHCVMNGDSETGITIMRVHPHHFDVGEIVRQYRVAVGPTETSVELEKRLAVVGSQSLMECLRDLPRCVERAVAQPKNGVTYAPKVSSAISKVRWKEMTSTSVYNLHRALTHIYPLSTTWHGTQVKLLELAPERATRVGSTSQNRQSALDFLNDSKTPTVHKAENSGEISYEDKLVKVTCSDNVQVSVSQLRVSGKTLSSIDFFNGYLSKRPKSEWFFSDP